MSRRLRVGDRVRIVASPKPRRIGLVCEIVDFAFARTLDNGDRTFWQTGQVAPGELMCAIDAPELAHCLEYPPRFLELIDDSDACDQSLSELLDSIRGVRVKEEA